MNSLRIVFIITATSTGLIAGLMYSYLCSVNPGLAKVSDREYISAMQAINRAILNPIFFASFMGTLILLPVNAWMSFTKPVTLPFVLLLSAAVVYIVGVFGVTMFGNVPLNEALDKFDIQSASAAELAKQRADFAIPWNSLHNIRTIASIVSFILAILSCLFYNDLSKVNGIAKGL